MTMKFLDSPASVSFQRTASGDLAFYPWGKFGRGYRVPGPREMARIHRAVKVYLLMGLVTIVANGLLWKLQALPLWKAAGLAAIALQLIVFHFHVRSWSLAPVDDPFVVPDNTESFAVSFNGFALWSLLLVMVVFAALGLLLLVKAGPSLVALSCTAMSLFGVIFLGRIALIRRRVKRRAGE
jgi:hypothetical protein